MTFKKIILPAVAIALVAGAATAPAFAQNRFMDEARDAANRRAENKAVREAEHPEAPATTTASTATPKPAETTPAAQTAPAAPAAPAPAQ